MKTEHRYRKTRLCRTKTGRMLMCLVSLNWQSDLNDSNSHHVMHIMKFMFMSHLCCQVYLLSKSSFPFFAVIKEHYVV